MGKLSNRQKSGAQSFAPDQYAGSSTRELPTTAVSHDGRGSHGSRLSWFRFAVVCAVALVYFGAIAPNALADITAGIRANFNGTAIAGGSTIWFTSVMKASGLGSSPVTIFVRRSSIVFSANGTNYSVPAPDANITFSPSATSATVSFNSSKNQWQVTVPSSGLAGNTLLDAAQFVVPVGGLPGGIKNVTWNATFSADTAGISINWQWAAAVYTSFNTNYANLGVKPVDDTKASQYQNSDHAGTPENYKTSVTGGATGGGGSNYTGSYSSTLSLAVPITQRPTANAGGPYSGYTGQGISFDGTGSIDPDGYTLNYNWSFGDGTVGTGVTPTHVYSSAGTFTVTLTVDDGRTVTATSSATASIAPPPPSVLVSVAPPTATLYANGTQSFTATVQNASNQSVTWTITPAGVGTISSNGLYTAPTTISSQQTVTVTATSQADATKSASATVTLMPSVSVSVTPTTATLSANGTQSFTATVQNASNQTVTWTITPAGMGTISSSGLYTAPTMISSQQTVTITASSQADPSKSASATVTLQAPPAVPPSISAGANPASNARGWNNSDVQVTFTCSPGSNPVASCPSPIVVSTEGATQQVCGTAVDTTGLSSPPACVYVSLDKTPPTISATASPSPTGIWNTTPVTVTFKCSDTLAGVATCPVQQTVATDGAGQTVTGTAVDLADNTASAQVTLNIDQIPPSILQFTAPSQLAPGQTGNAAVSATDNIGIGGVVIQLNGTTIATLLAPPYSTSFTVPSTANSGDTLTLTATVSDQAGNSVSASRSVQVVSSGVLAGQVLTDVTGLPLPGVTVQIVGGGGQDTSDSSGRYSIPSPNSHLFLSFSMPANQSAGTPAMVTVEREIFLQSGVGTIPVDARMSPMAAPVSINSAGGTLTSGLLTVLVAPGTVSSATNFYLTQLSQQGLPALLPLGWSPIVAFDLQTDNTLSSSLSATFAQIPSSLTLHLVRYDYSSHSWLMVTPSLNSSNGLLAVTIPSVGDFALVTADAGNTPIVIPASGQPIAGVAVVTLPAGASASGSLNPPSVSPAGGTSVATLSVQSSVPLPSGTVIQAQVQETYSLSSGKQLSSAKRLEDILLYQYASPSGTAGVATFPVAASQTFAPDVFSTGTVHLDILSGRESVRGQVGGNDAVTVTGGDATLTVSAGSLPQDTAISVDPEGVDTFLPSSTALIPLAEYNVDFSGETLTAPAQLSVAAGAAQPGDDVFLAQIQRVNGVPYLVVVSLAQVNGANLITQASPGLSGITQEGDYVFYKVTSPTGYVSGTVSNSGAPVAAMVQTDSLPFVTFSTFSGSYVIPALAGNVNLTASVPNTALAGSATTQVTAGQTSTVNLNVIGQTEAATVTPPNGAVGIPLTAQVDITAPDPFNQASVTSTSVTLTQNAQGTTTQVPIRFVFSQNSTKLSVFPVSALQPSTTYTLAASGLADTLGGLITVPSTTFTTQAITPPNFNTSALVFSMPDQNGNVQISAPANSFPPGTTILIVDQTNGVVLSLTVANDGSVSGTMPATIDDVLNVTITAPDKTTATLTISQFVAPDGTTAVGSGGGTVTGPGGTAMIIPQGALTKGTTFKLALLDQTAFPKLPNWSGVNFGSGLQITAPAMPSFAKEVRLAFPIPANAPQGAFFYVLRQLTDQNGHTLFETIDHAFIQGTGTNAQVVTASPPFCGYHNSYGNFQAAASASFSPIASATVQTFMLWDYDPNQPGVASPGLIVGTAQQLVPAVTGVSAQTTQLDPNPVSISLDYDPTLVTIADPRCATFSLFDPQRGGGLRALTASDGTTTLHATANEVNGVQPNDATFAVTAGLENQYRNIGRVNFLFPPATPPSAPPQISIRLFTVDQYGHRVATSGIQQTGTNILIAFKVNQPTGASQTLKVTSASIGTNQLTVENPDQVDSTENITDGKAETNLLSARVQGLYPLGSSGTYTITATALDSISLQQVTTSQSILVVAAGGGNTTIKTCAAAAPPAPITSGCVLAQVVDSAPILNATGVSPSVFPQITFSEPVTNITTANVVLTDVGTADGTTPANAVVPVRLVGVRDPNHIPQNQGPIADPVQVSDVITSLTIQPSNGLKYTENYTLTLNARSTAACVDSTNPNNKFPIPQQSGTPFIVDLNAAPTGPLCLQEFPDPSNNQPYQFTTFGPQDLGGTTSQYAVMTRPAVIGNYAYAGEWINTSVGGLGVFDITDPSHPTDLGLGATVTARTIDVAGQQQSPVTGSDLVAVSAGTLVGLTIPGNVYLFSAAPPAQPGGVPSLTRVGAVSVTSSASNGLASRLFLKDQFLYASTFRQGLQVIDVGEAIAEYQQVFATNPTQVGRALTTDGDGFAMDTIVNTISLPTTPPPGQTTGGTATMFDLKADDFATGGGTQTLIVAAGQLPLVVADPGIASGTAGVVYPPSSGGTFSMNPVQPLLMTSPDGKTNYLVCSGRAVALANLPYTDASGNATTKHVAVLVGGGASGPTATTAACSTTLAQGPVLSVVDLSQTYTAGSPFTPQMIGFLQLPTSATDVTVNGTTALVATGGNLLVVSLLNPAQPQLAGQVTGNFGNWVATNPSGLIVGSSQGAGSGVQVSSLGVVPIISVDASGLLATADGHTSQDIPINYAISGDLSQVAAAQVQITDDTGQIVFAAPVPVTSIGTISWPAGQSVNVTPNAISFQVQNPDGFASALASARAEIDSVETNVTPVIKAVTPSRISVGSTNVMIDVSGRNFLPSTTAQVLSAAQQNSSQASSNPLTIQFLSTTSVRVQIDSAFLGQLDTLSLTLFNGSNPSNPVSIAVVPAGLPPAPVLTSINPAQVPSNPDPQPVWITLNGSNFVQGDTIVKPSFPSAPLQVQVVSSTQMNVLIPAIWQVAPLRLQLHAESLQDSGLTSQPLDFQILNTGNILQPAAPPTITEVADGFVPLAISTTASPLMVTLQGADFQPGSQVIANVDGVTTTLSTSNVSASSLNVQIPPNIFSMKTYNFALDLQLQGAAGQNGQTHRRATRRVNTHKVTFDDAGQYFGVHGSSLTPLAGLGGFHTRTLDQNPGTFPDYFLMVPQNAPGNTAEAIANADVVPLQTVPGTNGGAPTVRLGRVSFDFGNPSLFASVVPASTSSRIQDITVTGNGSFQAATSPLNADSTVPNANGTSTKKTLGILNLQLMRPVAYNVNLHFVSEAAPANSPCNAPPLVPIRTPGSLADLQNLKNTLQSTLDEIWIKQANVKFTVNWNAPPNPNNCAWSPVATDQVHYDLGDLMGNPPPDGKLQTRKPGGNPNDPHNVETDSIIASIPLPNPATDINVYFVKQFATKWLEIDTTQVPNAYVGSQYQATVVAKGGAFPYNWAITQGALPPGFASMTTAAGVYVITGNPNQQAQQGMFNFTLQVSDQGGQIASRQFSITVGPAFIGPPAPLPPIPAPIAGTITLGFASRVGEHYVFIDDNTDVQILPKVLAHELGHTLGLTHMSEHQANDTADNTSCTSIPGLHVADSDFSDSTNLMWWYLRRDTVQSHLGIRNWTQLNNHAVQNCAP